MTHDELQAIKATLADLRKQMPLGFNDSETAVDIGDQLVAEIERLRAALVDAWDAGFYHSAEGWNGEYPFNHPGRPSSEEAGRLRAARDRDIADMK